MTRARVKVGEVDPWSAKVREAIVRGEYRCTHGSILWLWYPAAAVPDRVHALGNCHYCDFVLISTEEEPEGVTPKDGIH